MGSKNNRAKARRTLPPKPPSVCQLCWEGPFAAHLGLFDSHVVPGPTPRGVQAYSYTTTRAQLESAAAAGCVWCGFVLVTQSNHVARYVGRSVSRKGHVKITVGTAPQRFADMRCTPAKYQELSVSIRGFEQACYAYVYADADDPASQFIHARSPVLDVGSPESLQLAKARLDECTATHERCNEVADQDTVLPTRVLDCTDPARPRLVATAGKHGCYLALSYVWGEAQPHRTTTANFAAYTAGVDASVLPQTIRDAIHVTHGLGFQYLWADSLCIIQDSDEDKRKEIGRMHRIYRSAHLTIIAASAHKVSEGFLQVRQAPLHDIALPFICPPSPPSRADRAGERAEPRVGKVRIRPQWIVRDGHDGEPEKDMNYYDGNAEPISTRGWCLQELYMSPRALVFTSETLELRCQTTTQSVGHALRVTHATAAADRALPAMLFRPSAAPPVEPASDAWLDVHARWADVVKDYAQRAIGEPSDKLVACAALAEAFARVLRTDYLAGLWRARLPFDLLWHRAPSTRFVRAAVYRAPSWSWAAVDGPVFMWRPHALTETPILAEVVRCEVVLKDPELRFGQVAGGSLLLRAALVRCTLRRPVPRGGWHEIVVDGLDGVLRGNESDADRRMRMMAFIDDDADASIASAWMVPLLERRGNFQSMHGLVVVRAKRHASSTDGSVGRKAYRRIGTFDTDIWDVLQGGRSLEEVELV